jgi:hypothetical protein
MRKLLLLAAIGIASLGAAAPAKAQVSLSINIGSQPQWGPRGYDHVDYYYLPDVDSYYYVPTRQFVYLSGNRWIHARRLPSRYRNYDLYGGRKVVINSPRPWLSHNTYRTRYVGNSYYGRPSRVVRGRSYDRGRPGRNVIYRNNNRGRGHQNWDNHGRDRNRGRNNHGNDHGNHGGNHDRGGDRGGRSHGRG